MALLRRGDLVLVRPSDDKDAEANTHTGNKYRVEQVRVTFALTVLVSVRADDDAMYIFRECDLVKMIFADLYSGTREKSIADLTDYRQRLAEWTGGDKTKPFSLFSAFRGSIE